MWEEIIGEFRNISKKIRKKFKKEFNKKLPFQ